jgi:hypothetical protein
MANLEFYIGVVGFGFFGLFALVALLRGDLV